MLRVARLRAVPVVACTTQSFEWPAEMGDDARRALQDFPCSVDLRQSEEELDEAIAGLLERIEERVAATRERRATLAQPDLSVLDRPIFVAQDALRDVEGARPAMPIRLTRIPCCCCC